MARDPKPAAIVDSYGSDRAGLVCAYAFRPGSSGRPIDADGAADVLAGSSASAEFLWLHFSLSNAASEQWLQQHIALPDAFYDLLKENSSTPVEAVDNALLAVFNDVQFFAAEASAAA